MLDLSLNNIERLLSIQLRSLPLDESKSKKVRPC